MHVYTNCIFVYIYGKHISPPVWFYLQKELLLYHRPCFHPHHKFWLASNKCLREILWIVVEFFLKLNNIKQIYNIKPILGDIKQKLIINIKWNASQELSLIVVLPMIRALKWKLWHTPPFYDLQKDQRKYNFVKMNLMTGDFWAENVFCLLVFI